jgi:excinuclease ABC subunit A
LQRVRRGYALYQFDEPTTELNPAEIELLLRQSAPAGRGRQHGRRGLLDMDVVASADWLIDLGPGGGDQGGRMVAPGMRAQITRATESRSPRNWPDTWDCQVPPGHRPGAKVARSAPM